MIAVVRPQILYRMYDGSGTLLYVGITADVGQRLRDHAALQPWWREVRNITVEHYDDRAAAETAERNAIHAEQPPHNRVLKVRNRSMTISLTNHQWHALGHDRSSVIRQLVRWYLTEPGAQLPQRPERTD